jgi:hypothetical protein
VQLVLHPQQTFRWLEWMDGWMDVQGQQSFFFFFFFFPSNDITRSPPLTEFFSYCMTRQALLLVCRVSSISPKKPTL